MQSNVELLKVLDDMQKSFKLFLFKRRPKQIKIWAAQVGTMYSENVCKGIIGVF